MSETETIRRRRQEQWREGGHPAGKRFSQEELRDLACPSYKNLLLAATARLPSRDTVLQIADYLECTIQEANELLLVAQYMPEPLPLDGAQLALAEAAATEICQRLPLPAVVLTRGWDVHTVNRLWLDLHAVEGLEVMPECRRGTFHLWFDRRLPFRERMTLSESTWRSNVQLVLGMFRRHHAPYRYEPWYRRIVAAGAALPDFQPLWEAAACQPPGGPLSRYTMIAGSKRQIVQLRIVTLALGPTAPVIMTALPDDAPTRELFAALGAPTAENRWEHALAGSA